MNQRNNGEYKKNKTMSSQANSLYHWDIYSRNRNQQAQSSFRKKTNEDDDGWIGTQSTVKKNQPIVNGSTSQSFLKHTGNENTSKSMISNELSAKSPTQLIQGILKGLSSSGKLTAVNPFYSQESEQKLAQILTNQNKLESFIAELESQIPDVHPDAVKNYQILIILLRHISKSDVQVKHSSKGLQLNFNRNTLVKQQNEIERLEKKVKEKDEHIKEIIEQYELVVRNFNDVIQKLLDQRLSSSRTHQGNHNHSSHQKRNFHH